MGGVKNIIEGHINVWLDKNKSIQRPRLEICNKCPLKHTNTFWGWEECNPHAYINPQTDEFSLEAKPGYVKGCGCKLLQKTSVPGEKCPANKW